MSYGKNKNSNSQKAFSFEDLKLVAELVGIFVGILRTGIDNAWRLGRC